MNKLAAIFISFAAVLVWAAFSGNDLPSANSQSATASWLNGSLGLKIENSITGPGAQQAFSGAIDGGHCREYTFNFKNTKNGVNYPVEERGCAVNTAYGIAAGDYFHEFGEKYAGKLNPGGGGSVYPVPNSKDMVVIRNSGEVRIFRDFAEQARVGNVNWHEMTYTLLGFDSVNDQGAIVKAATSPPQTSKNGKWLLTYSGNKLLRINLTELDGSPYKFGSINGANRRAISESGRYAVAYSIKSKSLALYDLENCSTDCPARDITAVLNQSLGSLENVERIEFLDDHHLRMFTKHIGANGVYAMSEIQLAAGGQDFITLSGGYIAMGDSFASGEGDMDDSWYEVGTDEPENKCHLSRRSYPYLLHQAQTFGEFHSVACSGARIEHVFHTEQYPIAPTNAFSQKWLPGLLVQSEYEMEISETITISVGGNNIGFAEKLKECVVSLGTCSYAQDSVERSKAAMEIASIFDDLISVYKRIISQTNGQAKIYTVAYPQFITVAGDKCGQNVHLNREERIFIAEATRYMNQVIKAASQQAGVYYLDTEDSLQGLTLCSGADDESMAFNGITLGDDEKVLPGWIFAPLDEHIKLGKESYHPNQNGHKLMAGSIMGLTSSDLLAFDSCPLGGGTVCPVETSVPLPNSYWGQSAAVFVNNLNSASFIPVEVVPKSEQIISGSQVIDNGSQIDIHVKHLKPNSEVRVEIHSNPVVLGTFQTDSHGILNHSIHLPADIEPGFHNLRLYGQETAGDAVEYYQQILILGPEGDIDNDRIDDSVDPCGWVPASNVDADGDGIDDACDGVIAMETTASQGDFDSVSSVATEGTEENSAEEAQLTSDSGSTTVSVLAGRDENRQVSVNPAGNNLLGADVDKEKADNQTTPLFNGSAIWVLGTAGTLVAMSYILRRYWDNS